MDQGVTLKGAALLFGQGCVYVGLQAANVVQLARHHYTGAFVVGFLISLVWSRNVKDISCRSGWAGVVYSFGAAVGTVLGLFISGSF